MKIDHKQLRSYLMGCLPESSASEIDARLFADDLLHQDLEVEQESLIEEFLTGQLSDDEQQLFRAQIARSPLLRVKVESMRVLLAAIERRSAPRSRLAAFFSTRSGMLLVPALATLLCVAGVLYVRQSRESANINRPSQSLSHALQPIRQASANVPVTVAFLSANVVRGSGSPDTIQITPNDSVIELQVELRVASAAEQSWDVELRRGAAVIWKASQLPLQTVGREEYLALRVEAKNLAPGDYEVRYRPSSSDQRAYRSRAFRVVQSSREPAQ